MAGRQLVGSLLLPLVAGGLFGAGLALGGMTDPSRVIGFLNWFGAWDPTLLFVIGGATAIMALAWVIRPRLAQPILGSRFFIPDRRDIDARLVAGSVLFGIGWGLAGICPGPAVAILGLQPTAILPFIAAMLAGMLVHRLTFESDSTSR
jgi:uncharacterized membrane protein YedE/YeeE